MIGQSISLMSNSSSRKLDQFYTKPEIAKNCIAQLRDILNGFERYESIVEPSAGDGAFYSLLDPSKRIGLDIEPKMSGIAAQDFLMWSTRSANTLVVGNPPFGVQSALALKFFIHAAEFSNTIAFIVPVSWTKWSHQRRLPEEFRLIFSTNLPKNAFTFEGDDYDVPCVFQVWTRDTIAPNVDYRIRSKPITSHKDFDFLPKSRIKDADFLFVVCGARKQLVHEITSVVSPFTVERIKSNTPTVRKAFEEIDWSKYLERNNTGTMWINREAIVSEYKIWKLKHTRIDSISKNNNTQD